MVRFRVTEADPGLETIRKGFQVLKNYTGTKYILVEPSLRSNKLLMREIFEIVVGLERCRIY